MCGRYYVDDETSREIEKIVRKLDQRLKIEHGQDIHRLNLQSFLQRSVRKWLRGRCSGAFRGSRKGTAYQCKGGGDTGQEDLSGQCAASKMCDSCPSLFTNGVKTKKNILFKVQSRMPHYLWQGVIKSIMVKIVL